MSRGQLAEVKAAMNNPYSETDEPEAFQAWEEGRIQRSADRNRIWAVYVLIGFSCFLISFAFFWAMAMGRL